MGPLSCGKRGAGEGAHGVTATGWWRQARWLKGSPLEGLDVQLIDSHAVLTAMCLHPKPLLMSVKCWRPFLTKAS